jgi:hypothetical protein
MSALDDLMLKNPLEYTSRDISDIVRAYRELRVQFVSGVKPAKETKPEVPMPSLEELGLASTKPKSTFRLGGSKS